MVKFQVKLTVTIGGLVRKMSESSSACFTASDFIKCINSSAATAVISK